MGSLDRALDYASKGYSVFPLKPGLKTPDTKHGHKDATTDPDRIRRWWARKPDANIGIATEPSGLIVVDLDVKNSDGRTNWAQLLERRGIRLDAEPLVVDTPSGGEHHYYRGDPVPNKVGLVASVDIRSRGGYVVAPGSRLDGTDQEGRDTAGEYVLRGGRVLPATSDLLEAPEGLRVLLSSPETPSVAGERSAGGESLAELLQLPPAEGGRNDWLTKVAGHYAKSGHPRDDFAYLVDEASQKCQPPLVGEELRNIKRNIWEREQAKHDPQSGAYNQEVEQEARRLRVRRDAQRLVTLEDQASSDGQRELLLDGGAFMFDIPEGTPAIWGEGQKVLWAEGEALMIVGPPGVGKTTLSGQIVRARLGLGSLKVLGLPVAPTKSKVLYLAMDRPKQIARSLRRHFSPDDRNVISERLVVRKGPPPFDLAKHPEILLQMVQEAGADTVIIDSLKDAALGLSADEVGAGYNRARQHVLAHNVEVLELHHQKKSSSDGGKPDDLNGVYGSTWITSGAGSVVLLWGEAGDVLVDLKHLKQPAEPVGPWRIQHDHTNGVTNVVNGADPLSILVAASEGLTAGELAERLGLDPRSDKDKQRCRRDLDRLTTQGLATKSNEQRGKQTATVFRVVPETAGRLL